MKALKTYLNEARKVKFDTEWFLSKECTELFNTYRDQLTPQENDIFLTIESNSDLWKQLDNLMRSAICHADFDPEYCATSSVMNRIILGGVKKTNAASDPSDRIGKLSAESKKRIGMCLVCHWEA